MPEATRPVILGQFGPPTLACIRSWGRAGMSTGMICVQEKQHTVPGSRYLSQYCLLPKDRLYTVEGLRVIAGFLESFRASGLTCINEKIACWIQENRASLPAKVKIWLPSIESIQNVLSKEQQIQTAAECGLPVLPTYFIDSLGYDLTRIEQGHYPLCIRPAGRGTISPGFKVKLINNPCEFRNFLSRVNVFQAKIIAQPFMNLPNMVIHGARSHGGPDIKVQGFLVERKFEGVTLTIKACKVGSDLLEKCAAFTEKFDVTGPYHFEFLFDPRKQESWFMELNARLGGTTAKVLACGYDEPMLALQAYGAAEKSLACLNTKSVTSRISLMKYILQSISGDIEPFDYPSERLSARLIHSIVIFLTYRDDVLSFKDVSGTLSLCRQLEIV
ncbi:hypothetical protein [Desulfonatronovibrio hydrogenovorans]|uniref:hypothetical protein n=1 Tax=Desulfonatronovibrio hydrogenovorans TaxID=53245 RepID=UPI00048EA049|nr:hypothetical protein [Desulfonatronovibrio hydrogenovorans]